MFFLSANDAFTNPDSPWYYVVGTAFLVLIFVALGIYVAISKKKKKHDAEKTVSDEKITDTALPDAAQSTEKAETPEQPTEVVEKAEAPEQPTEVTEKTKEPEQPTEVTEKTKEPEQPTEVTEKAEAPEQPTEVTEKAEAPEQPTEVAEKAETPEQPTEVSEKAEEPEQHVEVVEKAEATDQPAEKPQKTARTASKSTGAKTASTGKAGTAKKKTQKPFIDRLIAAESAHGVYNELKNTILSYPGIKAKLTKDDEQFWFGEDKKAKIELKGASIMLYLSVDPATVPAQFGATSAEGDYPTALSVPETKIDNAQKLIMFAMNVSMLTRNEKHRHVNYIQNAINAKARSKSTAKG